MSLDTTINARLFDHYQPLLPDVDSSETHFFDRHVTARLFHLLAIPLEIITRIVDGILGIGGALASLFTLGLIPEINLFAVKHFISFGKIVARVAMRILLVVNPSALFMSLRNQDFNVSRREEDPLTEKVNRSIGEISDPREDDNFFIKHIYSRVFILGIAILNAITTLVAALLGSIAATLALMSLGVWTQCNRFAYSTLHTTGVIPVIWANTLLAINPWSTLSEA